MKIQPLSTLACPLDQEPLLPVENSLRCAKGHTFDRAREGYFNLLAVQWKGSKNPGDDPAMVAARARFLAAGFYRPIVETLFESLRTDLEAGENCRLADAGCGEGYYLRTLADLAAASPEEGTLELGAYDISKDAVKAAAKRKGPIAYFVASNRHPPFAAGSLDRLFSIFGFADWPAFAGILKPEGALITVDPGADHLIELREIVYPEVKPAKALRLDEQSAAGFQLKSETPLRFHFEVPSTELLADLLSMTPHGHRAPAERKRLLLERSRLELTADIMIRRWQRP